MFAQVATALTLFATLVHSVIGCCWHHEHAEQCQSRCELSSHCHGSGESVLPDGSCFGHDHEATTFQPPQPGPHEEHSPCDNSHGDCGEAHCVYTASDEVKLPGELGQFATFVSGLDKALTLAFSPPAVIGRFAEDHASPPRTTAEVRAQLQVWLI